MNLVTDRTQSDVLLGNAKGHYGITDLNRVEGAVAALCTLAERLDISCALQVKTDWTVPDNFSPQTWPTRTQMARYLGNVQALCRAVEVKANLPESMECLNWEGANNIEKALQAVYTRIQGILQTFGYSGEFFAGEENRL